jgi:Ca2+-binding RTX toxin-like protein
VSIAGAEQTAEGYATAVIGTTEDDTIIGSDANDILLGHMGNDILSAGDGDDILSGGFGDDTLLGGNGRDIFIWNNGDQGTVDAPAVDRLTDFSTEDTLNLADLLVDEESNNLFDYIAIAQQDNDVVLNVSPEGSGEVSQTIILENTSLDELGLTGSSQAELLQQMIDNGQLHVDQ